MPLKCHMIENTKEHSQMCGASVAQAPLQIPQRFIRQLKHLHVMASQTLLR